MTVYAIGDVQGCFEPLQRLLERIRFDPGPDRLWFTGDLVNRGPNSAQVLRFVKSLGASAITVLGNHDLHLLAIAAGINKRKSQDTLDDILTATDRDELLDWLRDRPLLHHDANRGYALVHAGLLPSWDLTLALNLAREVETVLTTDDRDFFQHMYGNEPNRWSEDLRGVERRRVIVNAFTRLRYCDVDGRMDLQQKGPLGTQPPELFPWFQIPGRRSYGQRIIFGHWSALGVYRGDNVFSLDSGCVWGRSLTALRLGTESSELIDVPCRG
jgi:bis(5'-nucleosyl)-tetraphosphatase (symmetrical)